MADSFSLRYSGSAFLETGLPASFPLLFAAPGDTISLGRAADNAIKLYSARLPETVRTSISRYHAHVWQENDGSVWLRDLGGSNGTYLGGTRLHPHEPSRWHAGAEVVFGGNSAIASGEPEGEWSARGKQLMRVFSFVLVRKRQEGGRSGAGGGSGVGGGVGGSGGSGSPTVPLNSVVPAQPSPTRTLAAVGPPGSSLKRAREGEGEGSASATELSGEEGGVGGGRGAAPLASMGRGASASTAKPDGAGGTPAPAWPCTPGSGGAAPPPILSVTAPPPAHSSHDAASAAIAIAPPTPCFSAMLAALSCSLCRAAPPSNPVASACGHLFCAHCFSTAIVFSRGEFRRDAAAVVGAVCPVFGCNATLATERLVLALIAEAAQAEVGMSPPLAALCTPVPWVTVACACARGGGADNGCAQAVPPPPPPPPHRAPAVLIARALLACTGSEA